MKPEFIRLPTPKIGGKIWLLEKPGLYVLERGEGVLRTIACTHAGAGSITVMDGVPNKEGFMPEPEEGQNEPAHGRVIYRAHPAVMGSWMLDGGFLHGLTIEVPGGHEGTFPVASIVWMPRAPEKRRT